MQATNGDLLTPTQASHILGVSSAWVRKLAATGALPGTLTPLGRLFRRADVERVAQQRATRQAGQSEADDGNEG